MWWIGVAVVLCCLATTSSSAWAAEVSGKVFNDFNTNGVFDTDPATGAVDVGVPGFTVRAFTGTHTLVGTATTAADGTYSMSLPDSRVRIQLEIRRPWWPSRQDNGLRSDEQFVDASSPVTGVDFGVHQIGQYSSDNPTLFWPVQWTGPVDAENPNTSESAVRGIPYFTQATDWNGAPGAVAPATFDQIGTVLGLGIDQSTGDLYAGAFYKRFAGLKDRNTGAIYRITQAGHVSDFATIPDTGTDGHPTGTTIEDWIDCAASCDRSWDLVGKIGLGAVVVDPGNTNLYTVNLNNESLYRLPLVGSRRARDASTAIPDPDCVGGDWRPFAAGFNRATGRLYVGGVCDAETSQSAGDLRAVVYRVNNPASSPTFTKVLDFALNYTRAIGQQYCGNDAATLRASPGSCDWHPWPTPTSTGGLTPPVADGSATFPLLSEITFEANGTMILAFRDLMGDMSGACIPDEGSCDEGASMGIMIHGDLLQAAPAGNGDFTLESAGRVGSKTSMGQNPSIVWSDIYPPPGDTVDGNWGYGPGSGPGGGFFYTPAPYWAQNNPSWNVFNAPFPYQGAATQVPGFEDVVTTTIHISEANENGLLWKNNDTGANHRALHNQVTNVEPVGNGFAKSNGLGDLDAYMGLAPVQIGNRLWYDKNRNGLQDASEPGVPKTVVELVDCSGTVIGKATTDRQGEYAFDIEPGTCYRVRVPLKQPTLTGWVVTRPFVGRDRRIDSSCRDVGGRAVMFVPPHGPGQNDFTYDCGFHRPPPQPIPPEPQPPEPQPPNPPEPDNPGVVPPSGPLVLVKDVLRRTGSTLVYGIIVRNGGPNTVTGVRVCDALPAALDYVSATKPGLKVRGREVCWNIASLSSGAFETLQLTARLRSGAGGTVVNCATATGTGTPTAPNVPGAPVGPVRACTTVHRPVIRPPPPSVTG